MSDMSWILPAMCCGLALWFVVGLVCAPWIGRRLARCGGGDDA